MNKKINCPRCGKETVYSTENKFRPFCSDRCQVIDLGDWASQKYAVPAVNKTPTEEDLREHNKQQNEIPIDKIKTSTEEDDSGKI